ncbi:hypothetical protein A9G28_07945 [Gilliamella sp. Fer1-1]|jgi:hypothetical protein|uniref:hypothetical protein n=1 Tax=unclassified Gilliamella TaxID=2685620 RepID=UPI00080EBAAD|nr:hypothetical protein [Gilliamella apicola]OCG26111.1 hypothetical protein A9G46_05710 [Gilliamella apicola]OCG26205.1 hypothetical protein A9G45_11550 [Gilliamella apicola]OCG40556.1 hypothetical protein A9G28_07945 [Gilliamella apicola]
MSKIINKKNFNKIVFGLSPFFFSAEIYAQLTAKTSKVIEGDLPSLSPQIEKNIEDLELFGLAVDGENYYGNKVTRLPISSAYPLKNQIKVAPIRQPDTQEYLDVDGDELGYLATQSAPQMIWYYTDTEKQLVEFTPTKSDTLCSLAKEGKFGPYKIKVSGDLILTSKYGTPFTNQYPNSKVAKHPSKTYTISSDAGFCYAKPELKPEGAKASVANQWDESNGFLIQSNIDSAKNFPTTAFYGAQFDLVLAQKGLIKNYRWKIVKGKELVTITPNNKEDKLTISFNTNDAKNPQKAWQHVIGSGVGYAVIIEGKNIATNNIIEYKFTLTKWFAGWSKKQVGTNAALSGTAAEIVEGCESLGGHYRISHANELSNAPAISENKNKTKFTREIGTLIGEWGTPSQEAYPNSWAAKNAQGAAYKRIWLYDTKVNKYCDLHTYGDAIYHCIDEAGKKNGVCTAVNKP